MSDRFEIRVDPFWRPLILPFGGTDRRSYAEIMDDGQMRVCFGFLFDHSFSLDAIERAAPARPQWWSGIGWQTNFVGQIGLLGSHDGCVEVRFRNPETVNMPLPSRCERLTISLKLPSEFLAALAARGVVTGDTVAQA
jgi:hypothetical protein